MPRLFEYLFATIVDLEKSGKLLDYTMEITYYEIYKEKTYDLLSKDKKNSKINPMKTAKGLYLQNAIIESVQTA